MPAKDIFHDCVKHALIKDGWTITHDPLRIRLTRGKNLGSSLLGMVRSGGINRLNPYLARDLID